jgi:hypothetical protein
MNGYPKRKTHSRPCVGDNDIVTGDGTMSIHDATRQLVVEVDGVSTRQTDSPAVLGGSGSGEGHAAKVGERGEALCATATDESEVPNDPFSIDLARGYGWRVQVWVTLWPVDWFSITALPVVVLVTAMVTLMTFPALTEKPLKSVEGAWSHSYQETKLTRVPVMQKSTPAWAMALLQLLSPSYPPTRSRNTGSQIVLPRAALELAP